VRNLNPRTSDKLLAQADSELQKCTVISASKLTTQKATGRFSSYPIIPVTPIGFSFSMDTKHSPTKTDALQKADFPTKFPGISSIKIIMIENLSCAPSGCSLGIQP
jgi:hypothetical protein